MVFEVKWQNKIDSSHSLELEKLSGKQLIPLLLFSCDFPGDSAHMSIRSERNEGKPKEWWCSSIEPLRSARVDRRSAI